MEPRHSSVEPWINSLVSGLQTLHVRAMRSSARIAEILWSKGQVKANASPDNAAWKLDSILRLRGVGFLSQHVPVHTWASSQSYTRDPV